jgi:hypothetical protein
MAKKKLVSQTFMVFESQMSELERRKKETGLSRGWIVRKALDFYFAHNPKIPKEATEDGK